MSLLAQHASVPGTRIPQEVDYTLPDDAYPYDEYKQCILADTAMTTSTNCGSTGYGGKADNDYDDRDQ